MPAKMTILEGNSNDKDNVRAYMVKGEKGDPPIWGNISGNIENQTDLITMVDQKIEIELENFEHLDYKVADSRPTPTEVVIGGVTYPTEEGVRYLVKHSTDDTYEEYILINGVIYDIGSTGDINLDNYYNKTETDTFINDLTDRIDEMQEYTTSEIIIGKWIDGKNIYRKLLHVPSIDCRTVGFKYVPHGITNFKRAIKTEYNIFGVPGTYQDYDNQTFNAAITAIAFNNENMRLYCKDNWAVIEDWHFMIDYLKNE